MSNATDVVQRFWSTLYARDWDIPSFFTDESIYFDLPTRRTLRTGTTPPS